MRDIFGILIITATASCERIRIDIGSNGVPALVFIPNTTDAPPGDILDFRFIGENVVSSVLLGTVDSPCTLSTASYFSNTSPILGDPKGVCHNSLSNYFK
jgi:hypothetical protein